jgi:hypothetical protein
MCRQGARNPIRSTQALPIGDVAQLTRQACFESQRSELDATRERLLPMHVGPRDREGRNFGPLGLTLASESKAAQNMQVLPSRLPRSSTAFSLYSAIRGTKVPLPLDQVRRARFTAVVIGFVEGYVLLPFGLASFPRCRFLPRLWFGGLLRSGCDSELHEIQAFNSISG